MERLALQVARNELAEALFVFGRHELLHQRMAVGKLDVLQHLPPRRALAEGLEPLLEFAKIGAVTTTRR